MKRPNTSRANRIMRAAKDAGVAVRPPNELSLNELMAAIHRAVPDATIDEVIAALQRAAVQELPSQHLQTALENLETDRLARSLKSKIRRAKQDAQYLLVWLALLTCTAEEIMEQCADRPDEAAAVAREVGETLVAIVETLVQSRTNAPKVVN
jgi:hypothetical protein